MKQPEIEEEEEIPEEEFPPKEEIPEKEIPEKEIPPGRPPIRGFKCYFCGGQVRLEPTKAGPQYRCESCGKLLSLERLMRESREIPAKSPQEEWEENVLNLLRARLPKVMGLSRERINAIIDTLEENRSLLYHPNSVWYHILQMTGGGSKINMYQLNLVLGGIFNEVGAPPVQQPPQPPFFQFPHQHPFFGWQWQPWQYPPPPYPPYQPYPQWQQPPYQTYQPGYPQGYPSGYQPEPRPEKPKKIYKVVIDGQEIECEDQESYRAWLEYRDRREREKREQIQDQTITIPAPWDENVKIQVPISMAWMYAYRREEEKVEIQAPWDESQTIKLPVSQALMLFRKEEPKVQIPDPNNPDQIIEVPASRANLMLMGTMLKELRSLPEKIQPVQITPPEEPTVEIPDEEGNFKQVKASQAPYIVLNMMESQRRKALEQRVDDMKNTIADLNRTIEALKNEITKLSSPEEIARKAELMGYVKGASPAFQLITGIRQDFESKMERLLNLLETQAQRSKSPPPMYSIPQREEKEQQIIDRLERVSQQLEAEEEILKLAYKLSKE